MNTSHPLLQATGLSKTYGSTTALADGDVVVQRGQVLALMGENGSGKSTFVKILSGVQRADRGRILLDGRPVDARTPAQAIRAGIRTVFQEVLVAPGRSVVDNVWLGRSPARGTPRAAARRDIAAQLMDELMGGCDPDAPAGDLSLSGRQALCIARAFTSAPRILVLDEATSALDVRVRDRLFAKLRAGAADGMGVIFISHRMDEVEEIADRATVFRNGHTVAHFDRADITPRELVRAMTGAEHLAGAQTRERGARSVGSTAIAAEATTVTDGSPPMTAKFARGEIVGLAGLEGHGQDQFLEILAGLRAPASGRVSPPRTGDARPAYVPRDRRTEGILPAQSILDNFSVTTASLDRRGVLTDRSRARARFSRFVEELHVKAPRSELPIESLSGGNQQKVVLARWLAASPEVLLLNDPTRGIDIGAKRDIYRALEKRADEGAAVIILSTEVDELLDVMDRVLVFREQGIFAELSGAALTRQSLVSAYFGETV
ncbi:sugar ABC transporter ATP-binding protein [Microbacterium sp. RD1]|uniref:sugar ABC transporter ATP-binding protein n=1 Tax=Microbacterium sp. RD1 TaxID=3457313 RepID=UPI003FA60A08